MKRQIIHIDQEKCNGCGACAAACHEGAIAMIGGKATLMRDDYCDGMGDCLPHCPTGAITFEQREAAPYNEAAVQAARQHKAAHTPGCPGSAPKAMHVCPGSMAKALHPVEAGESAPTTAPSQLRQWPVQIKLVPVNAPYFDGARLLIAADCTAYAYAAFHERFIRGHITLVGCPKLDDVDYSEKLTAIIRSNDIQEVTVVRMEVPLLRRAGKCRQARLAGVRQVHSVAGRNDLHRRADSGLIFLQKGLAFRKAVCYNNIRR